MLVGKERSQLWTTATDRHVLHATFAENECLKMQKIGGNENEVINCHGCKINLIDKN
jgi:hypothetical protein